MLLWVKAQNASQTFPLHIIEAVPPNYWWCHYFIHKCSLLTDMERSFGSGKNKDVVDNKTDGPGLLTEDSCMVTR